MTTSKGVGRGRRPGARAEAKAAREGVYNGSACKRCDNTERYTSNGGCIVCQNKRPPLIDKLGAKSARDTAFLNGGITYVTPNRCKKCGTYERYVSNAGCVECAKVNVYNVRAQRAALWHSDTCPVMWINSPPSPETAPLYALCPDLAAYGDWICVYTDAQHLSPGARIYPGCDVLKRPAPLQMFLNDKTHVAYEIVRHLIPAFYPAVRAFNLKVRGKV